MVSSNSLRLRHDGSGSADHFIELTKGYPDYLDNAHIARAAADRETL